MPGLLENTPQDAPAEQVNAEPQEAPQVEGVSEQAKPLLDKAVDILYGKNYDALIANFKQHGEQGFAQAMSTAVNGVLERLEKDQGEITTEILAEVGTKLVEMLFQDVVRGEIIQNPTKEMLKDAFEQTLADWGKQNPERYDPEEVAQAAQQASQGIAPEPQAAPPGVLPQGGV